MKKSRIVQRLDGLYFGTGPNNKKASFGVRHLDGKTVALKDKIGS